MNPIRKRALAVLCAAALLSSGVPALAAESSNPGISVQLDGEMLTFTDAAPEAVDGRTFLPVRAVFEAMGAQVSYDADTQTVTAVRDDTTVTMTLGSTEATVTQYGLTTPVAMDVAPYAHDNRTYVPVRFAAQAFGCVVGWDQDDQTVILIDTGKLVEETLAKYDYSYLEAYAAYAQKYNEGVWDMDADWNASLELGAALTGYEAAPITMSGTMDGTVADSSQLELAMTLLMDLRPLLESLMASEDGGMSATDTELLEKLAEEGVAMQLRGDVEAGQLYLNLSGEFLEQGAGWSSDTWYLLDLSGLMELSGMNYSQVLQAAQKMDVKDLVALLLTAVAEEPTDKDTAYAQLAAGVDLAAQLLRDDAFTANGSDRVLHYSTVVEGMDLSVTFTLSMDGEQVEGYALELTLAGTGDYEGMEMSLSASMDAKDQMKADLALKAPELLEMTMELTGAYAQGKTAPEIQPPEGAAVQDMLQLAGVTAIPEPTPTQP